MVPGGKMSVALIRTKASQGLKYPAEYRAWLLFELLLPLAAPLLIMGLTTVSLLVGGDGGPFEAARRAAGSGDLMIFAAFLLVGASARIRLYELYHDGSEDRIAGTPSSDTPFAAAMLVFTIYLSWRLLSDHLSYLQSDEVRLGYACLSVIFLCVSGLWVSTMLQHIFMERLRNRIEKIQHAAYYYSNNANDR